MATKIKKIRWTVDTIVNIEKFAQANGDDFKVLVDDKGFPTADGVNSMPLSAFAYNAAVQARESAKGAADDVIACKMLSAMRRS